MRSPFVFASYSGKDFVVVNRICELMRAGVSLDSGDESSIEPGKRWHAALTVVVNRICKSVGVGVSLDSRDDGSIEPGKRWHAVLTEEQQDCDCVLVFWSVHSAASSSVRRQYSDAIRVRQEVVAVLLDDTPLVEELCPCRSLDCRPFVMLSEESEAALADLFGRWVLDEKGPG
jgi:hypothetical protein